MELILNRIDYAESLCLDGYSSGGNLFFSVADEFFPAEHWYDCAFLDLKTWLPRLISFGSNHTDRCEFSFMDGPYTLHLDRRKDGSICAHCFRDHDLIIFQQKVDLRTLLKSTLSCCRKYDRFLYENGKANVFQEEIKTLMKLLDT